MWLRLLAERHFREGEKRPSEYIVMLAQTGSWAFGVKTLMGVSHSSKIGRANPVPILYSERPPAFDCVSSCVRSCLVPRSLKSIGTEARNTLLLPTSAVSGRYRWRGGIAIVMLFGQIPCRDFSRFWTPYLKAPLRLSINRGRVAVFPAIPSFKYIKKL